MSKNIKAFVSFLKKLWVGGITIQFFPFVFERDVNININSPFKPNNGQAQQLRKIGANDITIVVERIIVIGIVVLVITAFLIVALFIVRWLVTIIPSESPYDHLLETGMFFENQDKRYITWSEVQSLCSIDGVSPRWAIQTAINSFYAVEHLVFSEESGYRDYFAQWSWYQPDSSVSEKMAWESMSEYAKANVKLLSVARRLLS